MIENEEMLENGLGCGGMRCAECRAGLDEPPFGLSYPPCPRCGSRAVVMNIVDEVRVQDRLKATAKDDRQRSGKKVRWEVIQGAEQSRDSGRWVEKSRLIDRDANRYSERITDLETGEVLRDCQEPLSQHQGHGSAKRSSREEMP